MPSIQVYNNVKILISDTEMNFIEAEKGRGIGIQELL